MGEKVFTAAMLEFYKRGNHREMPWRNEKVPYRIWLSEIMLQQTRVEQGLPYYERFLNAFPDVFALAQAKDEHVFKLWEGLGYYARCRNLLAAARHIAFERAGVFPYDLQGLLELKGVGPYTAAAVASFAYDLPHAVVDGNVYRVLARYFAVGTPIDSTDGKKYFAELADKLLPKDASAAYNQAIMDFGATICSPLPKCEECLLKKTCKAYQTDSVKLYPVKEKKLQRSSRFLVYAVAGYKNSVLVRKRTEKDFWQDLWEFVPVEVSSAAELPTKISGFTSPQLEELGFQLNDISEVYSQRLTHRDVSAVFVTGTVSDLPQKGDLVSVSAAELNRLAFPTLIRNYLSRNRAA